MKAEEWKSRSIYQVLTDRFAPTSAASESATCNTSVAQYCGGTWQGIIRRLDYIQGMGFNAIWISPVTKQIENNTAYGEAYHGYWQQDIYTLNPHFGNASDLLALSQALHARGMALMVDVVVNHYGSPYEVDYSSYVPFNDGSYFHQEQFITDYNNQTMVEQGWLGDGNVPLPDINTEDSVVVSTFNSWISSLVQTYQIDGLRLDTVKHIRQDFWPDFVSSANVFALGEVLSGDPNYLSSYQPYVGGLLDYGTYYPLLRSFTPGGSMYELTALIAPSYRALFTDTQLLATFMENHDQPRFPYSTSADPVIVRSAMAYTMLSDGIPIIYYGQEQSFNGGADPYNREALWPSGYKITDLYSYLAKLNIARNLAWNAGFGTNLTTGLYVDLNATVSQKGPLLLVLSNQGSGAANKTVSFSSQFSAGTILVNILTCNSILIGKSSTSITIVSGAPQVYLPQGLAQQICTNIVPPTTTSTSVMSKISSLFTSSAKAASKSAAKSSQATYSSGIATTTSYGLAITKTSPTSSSAPLTSSTSHVQSSKIATTSTTSASARAGFPQATTSTTSSAAKGNTSSSTKPTSSSTRPSITTTTHSSTSQGKTTSSAKTSSSSRVSTTASTTKSPTSTTLNRMTSTSSAVPSTSKVVPTSSTKQSTTAHSTTSSSSSSAAQRQGFAAIKTSTTSSTSTIPSTTSKGRAGFAVLTATTSQQQQKRSVADSAFEAQPEAEMSRPQTPAQQQNIFPPGRKYNGHKAIVTTPPASYSQQYRTERSATTSTSQHLSPSALSSTYSYSAQHLPLPDQLSKSERSSSESNLQDLQHRPHRKGHRSQSQSLHTLRKQSSANSLSLPPSSRANSFGGGRPPVPAIKLDTRAALFAEDAPYAHTSSLSPLPTPSSRRSSSTSIYSVGTNDPQGRMRHASLERQNILAQDYGSPMPGAEAQSNMKSGIHYRANDIMMSRKHGLSKTSLHSHHDLQGLQSPAQNLPLQRRVDHRPRLQEDLRHFRI